MNEEQRKEFWDTDVCRICRVTTGKPYLCPNCQQDMIHQLLDRMGMK